MNLSETTINKVWDNLSEANRYLASVTKCEPGQAEKVNELIDSAEDLLNSLEYIKSFQKGTIN